MTANGASELGNEEAGAQSFSERPPGGFAPLARQAWIFLLDRQNVTGDLDGDALAHQGGGQIMAQRLAVTVELDQRLQPGKGVEEFGL